MWGKGLRGGKFQGVSTNPASRSGTWSKRARLKRKTPPKLAFGKAACPQKTASGCPGASMPLSSCKAMNINHLRTCPR
eukprot:5937404-Prorocentrum_lima.AAC.1